MSQDTDALREAQPCETRRGLVGTREQRLEACLNLFVSVIKSGEPWTPTWQTAYEMARVYDAPTPAQAGCDPFENGYDPKTVERIYRERIHTLEARATTAETALAAMTERARALEDGLRRLDIMIFHDPQIIERAGEMRNAIAAVLTAERGDGK